MNLYLIFLILTEANADTDYGANMSQNSLPINLPIIYEDEFIILINKPAGLPSQPTVDKKRKDLFTELKLQLKSENIFLHHRLDKDTSGIILFSKSKKANAPLTEMFKTHGFKKIYYCLTKPVAKKDSEWIIENHLIARRKNGASVKMFRTESGGDYAKTEFKLLAHNSFANYVEAIPLTGRTHQIRVHMLHSGMSILGDSMYGGKDPQVPRLMLHAGALEFAHPVTGKTLILKAEKPADFQSLLKKWQLEGDA